MEQVNSIKDNVMDP